VIPKRSTPFMRVAATSRRRDPPMYRSRCIQVKTSIKDGRKAENLVWRYGFRSLAKMSTI
jgi:hypothetical protein